MTENTDENSETMASGSRPSNNEDVEMDSKGKPHSNDGVAQDIIAKVKDMEQEIDQNIQDIRNDGNNGDVNEKNDEAPAEMPDSVIPLGQRRLRIENGIIAQDVNYKVIQDHGQMAPDDNTFFQIRIKFGCSEQHPSLSTIEL